MNSPTSSVHDPVCGMVVDPAGAKGGRVTHQGTDYFFCSPGCAAKFRAAPERYVRTTPPTPLPQGEEEALAIYTCPMHPQIRQRGPGACPICGMALEPLNPAAESDQSEFLDMRRRFFVSLALALPVFVSAMAREMIGVPPAIAAWLPWLEFALATPVVAVGGGAVFRARLAGRRLRPRQHVHADRAGRRRWRISTARWR